MNTLAPSAVAVGVVIVVTVIARSVRDGRGLTAWAAIGLFGGLVFAVGGMAELARKRQKGSPSAEENGGDGPVPPQAGSP